MVQYTCDVTDVMMSVGRVTKANLYYTQARKQTSGDPSGVKWNYRGITYYKFTSHYTLLYMVLSVTTARIVARLLNIY